MVSCARPAGRSSRRRRTPPPPCRPRSRCRTPAIARSRPIFEFTEVFQRTLGETSDIVTKEMYIFEDPRRRPHHSAAGEHGGRRPGGDAGGLTQDLPLASSTPARCSATSAPKGRCQFHQIGVELIGAQELADVEVIAVGADILDRLGVLSTPNSKSTRWVIAKVGWHIEPCWSITWRATRSGCRATASPGWSAIRCASSTAKGRGRPGGGGRSALAARPPESGRAGLLCARPGGLGPLGTWPAQPAPGPWTGLLHHRLRIRPPRLAPRARYGGRPV